jgi:hypothetical protein
MMKENSAMCFCDSGFAMRFKIIFSVVLMSAAVWSPRVTIAAEDDDRTLAVATAELKKYWEAVTGNGNEIPVRFAVDRTVSKSVHDAYRIKSDDLTC